jgi:hypothetical protein
VDYAALSAHTDAKGILQIVQQVAPAAVMLVHGEVDKMEFMCDKIQRSLSIPCSMPANGEEVQVASGKAHSVPVSLQLLRQLPASVQQLQDLQQQQLQEQQQQQQEGLGGSGQLQQGAAAEAADSAAAGSGVSSVGHAAAAWLQAGDVGKLAAAAMRLAGLAPATDPGSPAAAAAGAGGGGGGGRNGSSMAGCEGQGSATGLGQAVEAREQRLLRMQGTPAAARAAQLAPWLEVLAAAAQDIKQEQQTQLSHRHKQQTQDPQEQQEQHQQQAGGITAAGAGAGQPQQPLQQQSSCLQPAFVSLAAELRQQLQLEQQAVVVDGVLVVHHPSPTQEQDNPDSSGQQREQVVRMELLTADAAAAALQMQQHRVKLGCRLRLPPECCNTLQQEQGQQHGASTEGLVATGMQQTQAVAGFIAGVLRSCLSTPAAGLVQLSHDREQVQVRSVVFQHAAEASDDSCWKCSWYLADDPLAQQCVTLLQQAAPPAGG